MLLAATVVWMTHALLHQSKCVYMHVCVCVRKHMNVENLLRHKHYTIQELYNYKTYMKFYNRSSRDVNRDLSQNVWSVFRVHL